MFLTLPDAGSGCFSLIRSHFFAPKLCVFSRPDASHSGKLRLSRLFVVPASPPGPAPTLWSRQPLEFASTCVGVCRQVVFLLHFDSG